MLIPLDLHARATISITNTPTKSLTARATDSTTSSGNTSHSSFNYGIIGVIVGAIVILLGLAFVFIYPRYIAKRTDNSQENNQSQGAAPNSHRRSHAPVRSQTEPLPLYRPRTADLEVPPPAYIKDTAEDQYNGSIELSDMTLVSTASTNSDEVHGEESSSPVR